MNQKDNTNRLFKLFILLIFAVAAMLRFQNIFSAVEYDEIWTVQHYVNVPVGRNC